MDLWTQKCRTKRKNRLSAAELERLKKGDSAAKKVRCKMEKARMAKNGGETVVAVMAVVAKVARVLRRWLVEVELV